MAFSRSSSDKSASADSNKPYGSSSMPLWSQEFSEPTSSNNTICTTRTPAQQALERVQQSEASKSTSRIRQFASGFPRLRRSSSAAKESEATMDDSAHNKRSSVTLQDPEDTAVEAFMSKQGRDQHRLGPVLARVAQRLPSPFGNRSEEENIRGQDSFLAIPTTLKATISMLPQLKLLDPNVEQDFWVGVEIAGVLHHRHELPGANIDVVFVVDNGYYVSKECLSHALETATGALHQLNRGDRIAFYTTHCTHGSVASTVPDRLIPLRPMSQATEDIFRDLTMDVVKCGTQDWHPPRPNPPMANAILAIAKSLEKEDVKHGKCHIILLSPIFDGLHTVSDTFPSLHIHQINPAVLPYIPNNEHWNMVCLETCCRNVFVGNWSHYQSVPRRLKQIIKQARSAAPLGTITDVHVDVRPKPGCEVLEMEGTTSINALRLGQAHCFFVRVRVTPSNTQELDVTSMDPLLDYSLGAKNLRQDVHNAAALGAKLFQLLTVQVFYLNSLSPPASWTYTEAPLFGITELGRLALPYDVGLELCKRRFFQILSNVNNEKALIEVQHLAVYMSDEREDIQRLIQRMAKEIHWHHAVLEYEATCRQKLPSCTGPIEIASSVNHEHIQAKLDARMNKHKGMVVM